MFRPCRLRLSVGSLSCFTRSLTQQLSHFLANGELVTMVYH